MLLRFCLFFSFFAAGVLAQTSPLVFGPETIPNQVVGNYSGIYINTVSGGSGTYTVALTAGTLPPGLALSIDFQGSPELLGTPTTPGTYTFTLTVSDTSTPVQTASQMFSVTVKTNPLVIVPSGSLAGGVVGVSYSNVHASGGTPPYNWAITQGTLPSSSGLTLNATTSGQGNAASLSYAITGTPVSAGTYSFTLQVTDSSSPVVQSSQTYTLSVINPVAYRLPNLSSTITTNPAGIAAAANALWFTLQGGFTGLESITTAGAFQNKTQIAASAAVPTPVPGAIATGADGYLYSADLQNTLIYRAAPDGSSVTPISLQYDVVPPDPVVPGGVTAGPGTDTHIWFTGVGESTNQGYIGSITTDGNNTVRFYPLPQGIPNGIYAPISITPDPDGVHLWFLAQSEPSAQTIVIGRISTNGDFDTPAGCLARNVIANFTGCIILSPTNTLLNPDSTGIANSVAFGPFLAVGSDGGVWFGTGGQNGSVQIGKLAADGSSTSFFPIGGPVGSMTLAPDNAIWFTIKPDGNTLWRISSTGATTSFTLPKASSASSSAQLVGITTGPDGALWLTDQVGDAIFQAFPSLVLNCTVSGTLQVGIPISNASCAAAGGKAPYTYSFDTSNLPPGVSVSSTGVLSGTPTAPGSFIITANDSSSPAQQASQVFSIQAAVPIQLNCSFPSTGAAGQSYSGTCSTAGGNPPYTYTVAPALPAGLTGTPTSIINATTGSNVYGYSVTGTISPSVYGQLTFTITAADASTPPVTSTPQSVSVYVAPVAPTVSCAASTRAVVNRPFQQTCYGLLGAPPYTYSATGLPAGLAISSSGVISGTPAAAGASSVTVTLTDALQETASQTVSINVVSQPLALTCNFPFNPSVGTAISVACSAAGGSAPYASYALVSGTLPPGLTISAAGVVSGTPTVAGPASFTLQVTDSAGNTAQQSVNLRVQPSTTPALVATLPVPNPGLPYAAAASAGGGTPPFTFTITSGALPAGLTLVPSAGTIYSTGTLTPGAYSFTLTVTDSAQATASQTYSGTVLPAVAESFTSYAIPSASGANGITNGPDGNLWFTTIDQTGGNLIGRITPSGVITTTVAANALTQSNPSNFELPMGGDIAAGPDGQIWTSQRDGNAVGEITTDLSSQLAYLPAAANSGPAQITAAPDGTLWFTETAASQIAHVGANGHLMPYPTPSAQAGPYGIAVGPDNFIAFTEAEPTVNKIAVISEDGVTSLEFPIPTPSSLPTSIVLGPDSALWFTEFGANKIGRMDFAGNFVEVPLTSAPQAIILGPDQALYFTETAANKIGRLTIAGVLTEFPVSDANSGPTGLVAAPDGSIWFTENNLSKIGHMSFILAPTVSCTLPSATLAAQSAFTGSCSATQGTPPYRFSFSTAAGSTPPPGLSIDAATGAISGTLTTAGTFSFAVVVTDSSSPPQSAQQAYSVTVTPLPLALSCNVPTPRLYTVYSDASGAYGCSAVNGTPPYTYALAGTLPPGLTFDAANGNITGTPMTLGSYPFTVQVSDSSAPVMTASQAVTLAVQYGVVTGQGTQLFSLSKAPLSVSPGVNVPGFTLNVGETLLQPVSGTAVLTFTVNPALVGTGLNTPAGYVDPAMQFVNSSGTSISATYDFTFPAGASSITLPAIFPGTVLGTVDLTINAAGLPQTATTFPVAGATPVIQAGSVQFTNVTATGFDVEFIAMAPTRTATLATITFNPASGDQISGQQTFTFNVNGISNAWFASANGLKYGGLYSLTFPFVFNGSISAIGSATVTLDGSQPVTGNR
jgi:streptogramin lyase